MELLGCEDTRELRSPRNIFKLEILLKGIRVRQINAGQVGKERTVRKIVQNAGYCVFDRDGDSISVMVSRYLFVKTFARPQTVGLLSTTS